MALVTLSETKSHLGMPPADTSMDTELQGFIDMAQPLIEKICGPIVSRAVVEWHDGGTGNRYTIVLRQRPVISLTSVTEYIGNVAQVLTLAANPAAAIDLGYTFDGETGTVTRRVGSGTVYPFAWGEQNIAVAYTAGYDTTPANIRMAALELIRHLWQSTQQGGRPQFNGSALDGGTARGPVGMGYAVPNFVLELLQPNERIPGIA